MRLNWTKPTAGRLRDANIRHLVIGNRTITLQWGDSTGTEIAFRRLHVVGLQIPGVAGILYQNWTPNGE